MARTPLTPTPSVTVPSKRRVFVSEVMYSVTITWLTTTVTVTAGGTLSTMVQDQSPVVVRPAVSVARARNR